MGAVFALAWPLPALLAWMLGWAVFAALRGAQVSGALSVAAAVAVTTLLCVGGRTAWRRWIIVLGFPLSLVASGVVHQGPGWAWLLPLVAMVGVFPLRTWRDAPFFPTPRGALRGLAAIVPLAPGSGVLDAGCGLGDGLCELRHEYPGARLDGMEWSWPLRWLCGWRCRNARVRRADIWQASWADYGMVYVFQRPESMARVARKASLELATGAWLASLEFAVSSWVPTAQLTCADGRTLWLYRMPAAPSGASR